MMETFDYKIVLDLSFHLIIAIFDGIIIGLNREKAGKQAGLKTHTVVCIGSCLALYIAILMNAKYDEAVGIGRAISAVIQGLGFLGTGLIITSGEKILGLTSAATVWFVGILGLFAATDYWYISVVSSIIYVLVMMIETKIEDKIL